MVDKQLYYMGVSVRRVIYQHSHTLNQVRLRVGILNVTRSGSGFGILNGQTLNQVRPRVEVCITRAEVICEGLRSGLIRFKVRVKTENVFYLDYIHVKVKANVLGKIWVYSRLGCACRFN